MDIGGSTKNLPENAYRKLNPGEEYKVTFALPAGYMFTTQDAGVDDALDSDADPAMGGMTQQVTLTSGEFNGTLDAGLVRPASIGDRVWEDLDADGVQDGDEGGIEGVTVTLYECLPDGSTGALVGTTTTDGSLTSNGQVRAGTPPASDWQSPM